MPILTTIKHPPPSPAVMPPTASSPTPPTAAMLPAPLAAAARPAGVGLRGAGSTGMVGEALHGIQGATHAGQQRQRQACAAMG